MLHEKPNEFFNWKNKLGEWDQLPAEPVWDKAASWEKLHDRLLKKPRNKNTLWYWTAAACLLFIAGIQWTLVNKKNDHLVKDNIQPESEQTSSARENFKRDSVVSSSQVNTEKKHGRSVSVKGKTQHTSGTHPFLKKGSVVLTTDMAKETLHEIIKTIPVKPADTMLITATVPVKKKLRVVHINELSKIADEEIQFARNTSSRAAQTNIPTQDGISGWSLSKNSSDNLVKIKLSPSN